MRRILTSIAVVLACLTTVYAEDRENELTGVYRNSSGKLPARLELDGHGSIKQITVSGACLKDVPDGSRLWVKGQIKTWIQGVNNAVQRPASVEEITQQQPAQWLVVMVVDKCQTITKPFEDPKRKASQNKAMDSDKK